ncbi:CrcB protein [Bacillus mesophilus]|uniref:Fluoride-specific ion channel FluC n=1 Tax=Bacillus mesophilus TaxID=1808955 RepID=A0A6M0Q241_9BACI|nr:CrcB family protein [Bacillus mesophilus]MBM7659564.1 CrcB protein [Bacillus mesophilus]NEY70435.1 CrcB family protein [Bacillus mesophilus]
MTFFYVCLGGLIGALARYGLTTFLNKKFVTYGPYKSTLLINVVGSLILGVLLGVLEGNSEEVKLGVSVGVIGAFTTYSTFSLDCVKLLIEKQWRIFFLYSLSTFLLCVFFFYLGLIMF